MQGESKMILYTEELPDSLKARGIFKALFASLRPLQWIKNGFILIPQIGRAHV